jgi:predicted alpha/beta superfamily hydrolase
MNKIVALLVCIFFLNVCVAQYTLRLVVNEAATKDLEDWYVAGSFNNWNPRDPAYKLKPFGNKRKAIVLNNIPAGKYEFKFTRGSWEKVETTAKGEGIENRLIDLKADTIAYFRVAGWKDDYPDKPKPNTATAQVTIIDTAFAIPQLNRTRRIWVYLPKGYATSKKAYPVLYMHDGQNLFNEQTAPFGEWGVDEALDSLQAITKKEAIVVGIDNGSKRMNEYNPYDNERFGKGEGAQYVDFLVKNLKPFIDKKYRTIKDSAHTYIAGSSMGGLISLYALVKYPNVFGSAGVFSPAFWIVPSMYNDVSSSTWKGMHRFYFYAGGKESETMVSDMDKMLDIVDKKGMSDTRRVVAPLEKHNEAAWRKEFPAFYLWLMQK